MEMDWSNFRAFNGLFDAEFLKTTTHFDSVDQASGILADVAKVSWFIGEYFYKAINLLTWFVSSKLSSTLQSTN